MEFGTKPQRQPSTSKLPAHLDDVAIRIAQLEAHNARSIVECHEVDSVGDQPFSQVPHFVGHISAETKVKVLADEGNIPFVKGEIGAFQNPGRKESRRENAGPPARTQTISGRRRLIAQYPTP